MRLFPSLLATSALVLAACAPFPDDPTPDEPAPEERNCLISDDGRLFLEASTDALLRGAMEVVGSTKMSKIGAALSVFGSERGTAAEIVPLMECLGTESFDRHCVGASEGVLSDDAVGGEPGEDEGDPLYGLDYCMQLECTGEKRPAVDVWLSSRAATEREAQHEIEVATSLPRGMASWAKKPHWRWDFDRTERGRVLIAGTAALTEVLLTTDRGEVVDATHTLAVSADKLMDPENEEVLSATLETTLRFPRLATSGETVVTAATDDGETVSVIVRHDGRTVATYEGHVPAHTTLLLDWQELCE